MSCLVSVCFKREILPSGLLKYHVMIHDPWRWWPGTRLDDPGRRAEVRLFAPRPAADHSCSFTLDVFWWRHRVPLREPRFKDHNISAGLRLWQLFDWIKLFLQLKDEVPARTAGGAAGNIKVGQTEAVKLFSVLMWWVQRGKHQLNAS